MSVAVLALHGFGRWGGDFSRLQAACDPSWQVLAPDLPGWGQSPRDSHADYGYAAQAERLAAQMRAAHPEGVFLVGHSMGGGIAVMLAAQHPTWVRGLLLLAPGGARHAETPFSRAVHAGEQPFHVITADDAARVHALIYSQTGVAAEPLTDAVRQRMSGRPDLPFEQRVLDAIARDKQSLKPSRMAKRVACPVRVMVGEQDRVIHPSVAVSYQKTMPHAKVTTLAGCGHMLMHEAIDEVRDALSALVHDVGSSGL